MLSLVEGNQLAEEGPEAVNREEDHDLHCWLEVSWAENVHEVAITEANEAGLNEQGAHVTKVEELCFQVHDEILSLSVVPDISVVICHSFITSDWMELDHLT